MDSLTHAALGACLGEIMLSKKLGKRALLWGAMAQNFPDVDTVAALWLTPHENLLVHRGFTHSFLFAFLGALGLAWVARRWHKDKPVPWRQFFLFFLLQLGLHDLLDTCNAYTTGLLEPFSAERFSVHLLYVADPLFTMWPLLAFVALLLLKTSHTSRGRWAVAGLALAGVYLGYAVYNKVSVRAQIAASLATQQLPADRFFVTPTPFNSWLWLAVAQADSGYYVGHRSVFWPNTSPTQFTFFPRNQQLLAAATNPKEEIEDLKQFAAGYYTVEQWQDTLVFSIPRFGQMQGWQNPRGRFTFHYFLQPPGIDNKLVMQRGRAKGWSWEAFKAMWRYIFNPPEAKRQETAGAIYRQRQEHVTEL
ncbi:metal-dependent hydrolase [Rufibacter psychrotolerans]|uniref:metal-dependent hydrolase n=1 Tax=Rufibacter psychrotolerans TaxID=2812556 RepID=UPI001966F1F0|nr:metal-dependent hydrolase [Rufibacter sp. SYSU D00308]